MGHTASLLLPINIASEPTLIFDFEERYSVTPILSFFNNSLLIGQLIKPTSLFAVEVLHRVC